MIDAMAYLAGALALIGGLLGLLAAIGIVRMPDLYTRMHAATKAGTLGAGAIFLAVAAASGDGGVWVRALIGIGFIVLTTPVSAHLLARAARLAGYVADSRTKIVGLEENVEIRR